MISLFDCNFLSLLFNEKARVPKDGDGKPVIPNAQERIEFLVQNITKERSKIILPAPALAEFMLLAQDSWPDYLAIIRRKAVFEICGFDDPESVELVKLCLKEGKIKSKQPSIETWAKMKYDRQIVAIAKTKRVEAIYSTDRDVHRLADREKIRAYNLIDLPAPGPIQLSLEQQTVESNVIEIRGASGYLVAAGSRSRPPQWK